MDRSFLFVPGNRPERFDKALASGAHAVILDLEDAVAAAYKDEARRAVAARLDPQRPVWLRINGAESQWHAEDLAMLGRSGVAGVMLPKAEDPEVLAELHRRVGPDVPLVPLLESVLGLSRAEGLARAPGVQRLAFGSVDFQLDAGIPGDQDELLFARSMIVLASRLAGCLAPVDGVTLALDDAAVLAADVERSRRLGFGGKLCIHPRQVGAVNAGFRPPQSDVDWARRVLQAAEDGGGNAVRLDGKLIDRPVIDRARALLEEAGQ